MSWRAELWRFGDLRALVRLMAMRWCFGLFASMDWRCNLGSRYFDVWMCDSSVLLRLIGLWLRSLLLLLVMSRARDVCVVRFRRLLL